VPPGLAKPDPAPRIRPHRPGGHPFAGGGFAAGNGCGRRSRGGAVVGLSRWRGSGRRSLLGPLASPASRAAPGSFTYVAALRVPEPLKLASPVRILPPPPASGEALVVLGRCRR